VVWYLLRNLMMMMMNERSAEYLLSSSYTKNVLTTCIFFRLLSLK